MISFSEWFQFWFVEYFAEVIETLGTLDAYDILGFVMYFIRGLGTPI